MIPHNKPTLGKEERDAAARTLRSGWVAEGAEVKKFENAMCRYLGFPAGRAVATSSGTSALYLALVGLNVKKGSEVIVPTYTCSAVLNAVNMTGAKQVLVDIDERDLNISFDDVQKKINRKTVAIIVTHTFGMPANITRFVELGIPVIEDCAQAIGARVDGRPVGTRGTVAVFSFYATKMLTTGYGGMVVSRDAELIEKVLDYREFDCRETYKPRFNFQMSDINAAIGLMQLEKLPGFLQRRRAIAREYEKLFPKEAILWPQTEKARQPNYYRILLKTDSAKQLKAFLSRKGISAILPIETYELLHRYLGMSPKQFPVSERIANSMLSLSVYPSLTDGEVQKIVAAIREYVDSL